MAAVLPGSQAMKGLAQQRQQMIGMEAASHTTHLIGIPEVAAMPDPSVSVSFPAPDPGPAQSIAFNMMSSFGFVPNTQFSCLDDIYTRESCWRWDAANASGPYGITADLARATSDTQGA